LRVSPEAKLAEHLEISVMLSSSSAIQTLNRDYREKDSATNVLSFPAELPELGGLQALGDIVFGVEVIRSEAMAQNKSVSDHWAHLTVHGVLHLAGLDHDNDTAAAAMEAAEIQILLAAGVDNPYLLASDTQAENP